MQESPSRSKRQLYVGAGAGIAVLLIGGLLTVSRSAEPAANPEAFARLVARVEALESRLGDLRVENRCLSGLYAITLTFEDGGPGALNLFADEIRLNGSDSGGDVLLTNCCLELSGPRPKAGGDRNVIRLHSDWQDGARLRFERGSGPRAQLGINGRGDALIDLKDDRGPKP